MGFFFRNSELIQISFMDEDEIIFTNVKTEEEGRSV